MKKKWETPTITEIMVPSDTAGWLCMCIAGNMRFVHPLSKIRCDMCGTKRDELPEHNFCGGHEAAQQGKR